MANITRFIRTHVRHTIVAVGVIVALAVGGVAYAVTNAGGGSPAPSPQAAAAPPSTSAPKAPHKPRALRGQLTAIAPGSWTIQTAKGQTVVVIVNAQTKFGSKKAPATETAFAVGDHIVVSGPQTATSVVATRIAKPAAKPAGSTAPTTSTTVPATPPA